MQIKKYYLRKLLSRFRFGIKEINLTKVSILVIVTSTILLKLLIVLSAKRVQSLR